MRLNLFAIFCAVAFLLALAQSTATAADGRVELTLTIQKNAPLTASQQWLPVLDEVGFSSTRISSEVPEKPLDIVKSGTDAHPSYRVNGILTANGDVLLPPGRKFSQSDKRGMKEWIRALRAQGPEGTSGVKLPFGLTKAQFEEARKDLRTAATAKTKGAEPVAMFKEVTKGLTNTVVLDADAEKALAASGAVRDELQGLAIGTAVAALVRPAGLVLQPRASNGRIEYLVTDGRGAGENWPIGWASKEGAGKLVPTLLEKEETQDIEVPLAAALGEIQTRVGVPFVYDYNGMATIGVDLASAKTQMKAGQIYYGRLLTRMLTQAKLKYEVRQDDAGRPFLWIATIR
jgi:hypothetical protein